MGLHRRRGPQKITFSLHLHNVPTLQLLLRQTLPNYSLMSHSTTINTSWRAPYKSLPSMDETNRKRNWLVPRGSLMNAPEGWLIDPNGKWLLLFHKDPMSLQRSPFFYMDKWDVSPKGTPTTFINRRKVLLEPTIETWNELIQNGWKRLEHQFGETA